MIATKERKAEAVQALVGRLRRSPTIYLTDFTGLDVARLTELRRKLRAAGVEYVVVKNTLAKRAFGEAQVAGLDAHLRSRRQDAREAGASGWRLALMIAVGIGLHNLGEGLAIGAAYALGEAALGAFLMIGFMIHNTTEGLGIVAPIAKDAPRVRALAGLGLLAGAPTILGAAIGGLARWADYLADDYILGNRIAAAGYSYRPFDRRHTPGANYARVAGLRPRDRLAEDRRRGARHSRQGANTFDLRVIVGDPAGLPEIDVRLRSEDPVAQLVLQAGHERQHHDQCRDADGDPDRRDQRDHRNEGLPPLGEEIPEGDVEFEGHGIRPRAPRSRTTPRVPSGQRSGDASVQGHGPFQVLQSRLRICGNKMTSRIDALSVSTITSRSIPTPSPAVGGRPYARART